MKARWLMGLTAGCLVVCGATASVTAQTPVDKVKQIQQILGFQPKQADVDITTPAADDVKDCDVKLVPGTKQGSASYLLKDKENKTLRHLADTNGDRYLDVWSYYKNGLEVYREIDTNYDQKPDQYRWFNAGGMKWGIDINQDGRIDSWKSISAEEAAQEAFQAMIHKDFARLQAVMVSESELQGLGLPATFNQKIQGKIKEAPTLFQATVKQLPDLTGKDVDGRVEPAVEQCVPGESLGASQDLFRHPNRIVLFEIAKDQHEWINTGEMIKIGNAWRLLEVPYIKPIERPGDTPDPKYQQLIDQLAKIDAELTKIRVAPGVADKAAEGINQQRVAVVEQIIPLVTKAEEREVWLKQVADALNAAAGYTNADPNPHLNRLRQYQAQMEQQAPKSNMTAYYTFRVITGEYMPKMSDSKRTDQAKVQAEYMDKLAGFVQTYSTAEDTPDALYQLAVANEFNGKEDLAKGYYQQLATNFATHMFGPKAAGAVRRLNLVGHEMELTAKTVAGQEFDLKSQRGKVVAVYYWATYCSTCESTFAKLKKLHETYGPKGFEIVTINLDDAQTAASDFLTKNVTAGHHLYHWTQGDGLSSPLANQYGIIGLPSLFLVGKDGNVISRTIQINDLEDAIQKGLQ